VELMAKALQLLGKDFALVALGGGHDGESNFTQPSDEANEMIREAACPRCVQ
jgi:hypothetical protein